jgi:hypothetical protein
MREKLIYFKMKTVNNMAENDLQRLLEILIDEKEYSISYDNVRHFEKNGMRRIGWGSFGNVFEFIGSDGYKYAVKTGNGICDDGKNLERLQGIKGYPKLFSYVEGKTEFHNFYIMISQMINGFTLEKITNMFNRNEAMLETFKENVNHDIVEVFRDEIELAYDRNVHVKDIHAENVMFNIDDGLAYIVDVGNYWVSEDKIKQEYRCDWESFYQGCRLHLLEKYVENKYAKVVI